MSFWSFISQGVTLPELYMMQSSSFPGSSSKLFTFEPCWLDFKEDMENTRTIASSR
jgi:hypothetical protein